VFEKTGVVQVFCNIHPKMRALIYVTPNVCFTRADAEGRFEMTNVPPGEYEICAWHERCGELKQPVTVSNDPGAEILFTLEENRDNIMKNNAPRRDDGYGVERGLGVKREELGLPVVEEAHPAIDPPM
jgi:hypothetical protein